MIWLGFQRLVQIQGFPDSSDSKESAYNAEDLGSIAGLGRSPGEGNGNLLQYSYLDSPIDRGAWPSTVHGVAKSDTTKHLTVPQSCFFGGVSQQCVPLDHPRAF